MDSIPLAPHAEAVFRDDAGQIVEALRLYDRYVAEVVESFNVCPFAKKARHDERVKNLVLLAASPAAAIESALGAITALQTDSDRVDIAQLIFPRLSVSHRAFDKLHADFRERSARLSSSDPAFVSASFHPDYPFDPRSPAQLVPFLRRTPDATIQLLNFKKLREVRNDERQGTAFFDLSRLALENFATPARASVTEQIAANNFATVEALGQKRLLAIYDDIRADRERSYAKFFGP